MPHEQMTERQVAAYLHLDVREVARLASRGKLPARRRRGKFVFVKSEVDHWVEQQIHSLSPQRLADIAQGVSAHHGLDAHAVLVAAMIPSDGVAVPLKAKTADAALRALVDLACAAGRVHDRQRVLEEVRAREKLCSTAVGAGAALPHPRHPMPYDIESGFIVVGLAAAGIPFGAPDGALTRLFFLVCCKDDRTHLHVLARLVQMLHDADAVGEMLAARDGEQLTGILHRRELAVLGKG
jgi:PTS system nitrogen regulatory IIA component